MLWTEVGLKTRGRNTQGGVENDINPGQHAKEQCATGSSGGSMN